MNNFRIVHYYTIPLGKNDKVIECISGHCRDDLYNNIINHIYNICNIYNICIIYYKYKYVVENMYHGCIRVNLIVTCPLLPTN